MEHKGMWADFPEEDIELLRSLWLEEGKHRAKAAERSSQPKRSAKSQPVKTTPDPEAASSEAKPKC
jgi:hypothetical protein